MLFFKRVTPFSRTQGEKEAVPYAAAGLSPEDIVLSETSQPPKDKHSRRTQKKPDSQRQRVGYAVSLCMYHSVVRSFQGQQS